MIKSRKQKTMILAIVCVAVLTLSIGFAAFSTILEVTSTATVSPDSSLFAVKFSRVSGKIEDGSGNPVTPTKGNGGAAEIDNNGKPTIGNLSAQFTAPGQEVVYEFYAVNESPYNAYLTAITYKNILNKTLSKECTGGNGASEALVTAACNSINVKVQVEGLNHVTGTTSITNHLLQRNTSEKITVTIEYLSGPVDGSLNVTFGDIELTYSTVDNGGSSGYQVGDVVTLGGEQFYVIPNDSTAHTSATSDTVTLLAKYNLYVGSILSSSDDPVQITGTPVKQSSSALGWNSTSEQYYGIVPFSSSAYWGDVTDGTFVYSDSATISTYVNEYKTYLEGNGANVKEASLISYKQLTDLGCTYTSCLNAPSWVYLTSYWTGSARSNVNIRHVRRSGYWYDDETPSYTNYNNSWAYGVRPVIVVNKSDL